MSVAGSGATQQVVASQSGLATQQSNEANSRQRLQNGKPGRHNGLGCWSGAAQSESGKKIENVVSSWSTVLRGVYTSLSTVQSSVY